MWHVLHEARQRYVGADLELPPQRIGDLRDAPGAQREGVRGAHVLQGQLHLGRVPAEAHLRAVEIPAMDVAQILELRFQGRRRRPFRGDDDLVPERHVCHQVRQLRIGLL